MASKGLASDCQEVYEASGQSAVFDYILSNHPETAWDYCEPCEIQSPMLDGDCLVCGSRK